MAYDISRLDSHLIRRNSDPAAIISSIAKQRIEDDDDEQPLDFSKKSRNNSSNSESQNSLQRSDESSSPVSYYTPSPISMSHQQMSRPSVITCAPTLRANLASPNCQHCSPNSPDPSRIHGDHCRSQQRAALINEPPPPYSQHERRLVIDSTQFETPGHREKPKSPVVSGICDPMIDEHFRRSLGKEYSDLLGKTNPNPKSATVSTSGK